MRSLLVVTPAAQPAGVTGRLGGAPESTAGRLGAAGPVGGPRVIVGTGGQRY